MTDDIYRIFADIVEDFISYDGKKVKPEQLCRPETIILFKDIIFFINNDLNGQVLCDDLHNLKLSDRKLRLPKFSKAYIHQNTSLDIRQLNGFIVFDDTIVSNTDYTKKGLASFSTRLNELSQNIILNFSFNDIGVKDVSLSGKSITGESFKGNRTIEKLSVNQAEYIGRSSFSDCENLKEIFINGCESIDGSAFKCCSKLQNVSLSSVMSIQCNAFQECVSMKSIDLTQTHISVLTPYMFAGCSSLSEVFLPSSVVSIDVTTFNGCESLNHVDCSLVPLSSNQLFQNELNLALNWMLTNNMLVV